MDSDLDPFGDILPESGLAHARPVGKFQPRAKPRPKKVACDSLCSVLPTNVKEKSVSSSPPTLDTVKSVQSIDTVDDGLRNPVSSAAASSTLSGKKHLESNEEDLKCQPVNTLAQLVTRNEDLASADALPSVDVASDRINRDSNPLITETDSSLFDIDALADIICDASVDKALVDSRTTMNVHHVDVDKTMDPVGPSLPGQFIGSNEPSKGSKGSISDEKSNLELASLSSEELEPIEDTSTRDNQTEMKSKNNRFDSLKMELELDPFVDIIIPSSTSDVRAGSKFRPRAKPKSGKGASEAVSSAVSNGNMEHHISLASTVSEKVLPAKFVDVGGGRVTGPVDSSLTTLEVLESGELMRNDDSKNSGVILSNDEKSSGLENSSQLLPADVVNLGADARNPYFGLGKSVGENTDLFSGLEYVHNFDSQSLGGLDIPLPASNEKQTEGSGCPTQNAVSSLAFKACNMVKLDAANSNDEAAQTNNRRPGLEGAVSLSNSEKTDNLSEPTTTTSECCTRKFRPEPNVHNEKEKSTVSVLPPDLVDTAVPIQNAEFDPSETVFIDEGSIPTFPSDDVLDYSSMGFGNFISPDSTTCNNEQLNVTEASHSCDPNVLHQKDLTSETAKESSECRKRKSSLVSNLSQNSGESLLAEEMGGIGKSSRQLRRRTATLQLIDEPEDEACDNEGFPSKASSNSISGEEDDVYDCREDEDNDGEERVENASYKKRASKKPKKPVADKEKIARKRKKDNDASKQSTQVPRKKFSHSTRRKNRLKDLLTMPEDEIDFQRLPVKDIILLAGYKESLANKEAKASKKASTDQSTVNSLQGGDSHNEETVASDQDGRSYADDQSNALFNYHSFMDKTPTARWSKQDTELFYEGIQQFGTDLSMIQQLFPGRTRHQIKLKYKKEERQHPLRLSEALSSRSKDRSYFEKVIEQLQQVAAQAEQESNRDDAEGAADEAELNPETNEEDGKSEQNEDVTDAYQGDGGVHSPSKYEENNDEDEDEDIWSSYKSVF